MEYAKRSDGSKEGLYLGPVFSEEPVHISQFKTLHLLSLTSTVIEQDGIS
jgi:hypothetical protein